jgi:dipeptidase E
MKLLLTSAGISNPSIADALVELLGKPVAEATALFVPTAIYGIPNGPDIVRRVIRGSLGDPFCEMGWKSLGLLELTALPTMKRELWVPMLEQTDALLVGGLKQARNDRKSPAASGVFCMKNMNNGPSRQRSFFSPASPRL